MKILFLCLLFVIFLTSCQPENGYEVPLIRPESARVDSVVADVGPVVEVTKHLGITRYVSVPVYFANPIASFGEFYVSTGDVVVEGQLLARLITDTIDNEIESLRERIDTIRRNGAITLELRDIAVHMLLHEYSDMARRGRPAEEMQALGLRIERERLEQRIETERLEMSIRHEEERLRHLEGRLVYTEMLAPFDGVVTFVENINRGQHVGVMRPLIYMTDRTEVIVEIVDMTGANFPAVMPGQPLAWRPFAVRDALAIRAYIEGVRYDLEFIITPTEHRHYRPVWFEIVSDETFSAGKLVPVYFYLAEVPNAVRIPSNAVFVSPAGLFVYKIVNEELIHTEIEILARTTSHVAILNGLEVGDEVFVRP